MSASNRTYVTFCAYTEDVAVHRSISQSLGIAPTRESNHKGLLGWFLSTEGNVTSLEVNTHLERLLKLLSPHASSINELGKTGCMMRVFCFWESASGNGGPVLSSKVMGGLAALNLELHFDLWFTPPEDE